MAGKILLPIAGMLGLNLGFGAGATTIPHAGSWEQGRLIKPRT